MDAFCSGRAIKVACGFQVSTVRARYRAAWIDLNEALSVIPADSYKSGHMHVLPLVPQAVEILKSIPKPTQGPYLLSTTGGSKPIRKGISKFYRTRLRDQIIANTGAPLTKRITSQTLRRTVATGIAQPLGFEGEKLVKRVLGHSDGSVTAIYNRYGYVREMRRALEQWANELTSDSEPAQAARTTGVVPSSCESAASRDGVLAA